MFTHVDAIKGNNMGTHTVTEAEATANKVEIDFSKIIKGSFTLTGFIVSVYRGGIQLANAKVSLLNNKLTIRTNSTDYVVTKNDVISYLVF
jgi:hypothetical protein